MKIPKSPNVYEIHTAVFLDNISKDLSIRATLADIPDNYWENLKQLGMDAVWLMGVWERSPTAKIMGKDNPELSQVLPDLKDEDILGSAYSIYRYEVDDRFGGREGLKKLRQQLAKYDLGLILDFVPNHVAIDHPWTNEHLEYFVQGDEVDLAKRPNDYFRSEIGIIARGRDPNFPPWSDVAQLNAFSPDLRHTVKETLIDICSQADGVRCDMAMLMLNEVYQNTWGKRVGDVPNEDFWPGIITEVKRANSDFIFIAEVYWDLEDKLLSQGFDYCYDKKLYDALVSKNASRLKNHLEKTERDSSQLIHFIENHDEKRAAHELSLEQEKAAAVIMATQPGAKLYYDGQFEGHKTHIPVHLGRAPKEVFNLKLNLFYKDLLNIIKSIDKDTKNNLAEIKSLFGLASRRVVVTQLENDVAKYIVAVNYTSRKSTISTKSTAKFNQTILTDSYVTEIKFSSQKISFDLAPWGFAIVKATKA